MRVALGDDVDGVLKPDSGSKVKSVKIKTTPEQDNAIEDYLDNLSKNPGQYSLHKRNCSIIAARALKAGSIDVTETKYPKQLIEQLSKKQTIGE